MHSTLPTSGEFCRLAGTTLNTPGGTEALCESFKRSGDKEMEKNGDQRDGRCNDNNSNLKITPASLITVLSQIYKHSNIRTLLFLIPSMSNRYRVVQRHVLVLHITFVSHHLVWILAVVVLAKVVERVLKRLSKGRERF